MILFHLYIINQEMIIVTKRNSLKKNKKKVRKPNKILIK